MYRRCIPMLLPFNVNCFFLSLILLIFTEMVVICVFVFSFFTSSRRERSSGILKTGAWTRTKLNTRCDCVWRSNVRPEQCASGGIMYNFKTFWIKQGKKAELKCFIIELSKEYSILSQFTSFVAIEERVGAVLLAFGSTATVYIWSSFPVFIQEPVTLVWGCDLFFFWLHVQICDVLPQNPALTLKRPPLAL